MYLNNLQSFIIVTLLVQINHVASQVIGSTCNSSSGSQLWKYNQSTGQLQSSSPGEPCLTMSSYPGDGTQLLMSPCSSGSELQAFDFITGNLIVARVAPTKCVNLAGYGTSPGTIVWIYGCVGQGYTCEGNCDWISLSGSSYQNPESKLCLDDGYAPPLLHTCEPGSPSFNLPFCNYTLSRDERIKDLVSRLPLPYKLSLFALPLPVSLPALVNESLSLAAFNWDITTIHGLSSTYFISPLPNATMFPHAIAQGSSFDVDLAVRIAKAVSYEARAVSQRNFRLSNGRSVQALNSEGGPLANSCHHPGWGRAMETYGEDPHLITTMGTAITLAMQNETNGFLQLSSVTRHYLGYHGATDLPNSGEEWVTEQWFRDQHLPAYESYLTIGKSEGVMCSCNTLRVGEGDGPEGGIPACVHPLLYDILRNEWNSTCEFAGLECNYALPYPRND